MEAINDWVLIYPEKINDLAGGLVVPDAYKEDSGRGTVFSCGKGTKHDKMTVKPGDGVIWDRLYGAGFRFEFEGREVIALRIKDIFGTL